MKHNVGHRDSFEDDLRPGRLGHAVNEENVSAIELPIEGDARLMTTLVELCSHTRLSQSSVFRIMHEVYTR